MWLFRYMLASKGKILRSEILEKCKPSFVFGNQGFKLYYSQCILLHCYLFGSEVHFFSLQANPSGNFCICIQQQCWFQYLFSWYKENIRKLCVSFTQLETSCCLKQRKYCCWSWVMNFNTCWKGKKSLVKSRLLCKSTKVLKPQLFCSTTDSSPSHVPQVCEQAKDEILQCKLKQLNFDP